MSTEGLKTCTSCGDDWPADAEFFHKRRGRCTGLVDTCKACSARTIPAPPQRYITDCLQGLLTGLLHQGAHA